MKNRLRVLLIAERANPEYTSIPLHGWSHGHAIAQYADVHMVTQHWNGPAFKRAGFTNFTGINTSIVHEPMKRLIALLRGGEERGWTTDTALSALEYYYFEWRVWQLFKRRIRAQEFDLVHRLIPSSPTVASPIAKKCKQAGVPFILGPLNGGLPWPAQFADVRRREKEWLSYVRDGYRLMPGYKSTRQSASAIITASQATQSLVNPAYQDKCVYIPENGISPQRFTHRRSRRFSAGSVATDSVAAHSVVTNSASNTSTRPLKVIFVGRLVPYKGADMLIEAARPLLQAGDMTLEIVGEGPERGRLEQLIQQYRLTQSVALVGKIAHQQVSERLAKADIFAFPSIREFGGAVVIEAMATGLACIVVDYGGPGELVDESTGYRVPLGSRVEVIAGFRRVLSDCVARPQQIDLIGDRARKRAFEKFTWDAKAKRTLSVYAWALSKAPKPDPHFYQPDCESGEPISRQSARASPSALLDNVSKASLPPPTKFQRPLSAENTMTMPLVSVVIPAYNSEKTLLQTVASVLNQTYQNIELIVINDGSTDGTLAQLETVQDSRLKVFSYENGGLATARNRGIERASGDYLTFIDADDLWTPEKVEAQVTALQQRPEAGVAYSWTRAMDSSGTLFYEGNHESYAGDVYAPLLRCNFITSGSNVMITRKAVAASGVFDSSLRYCEDWDYYLRLARTWPFVVVPRYQILYRQTEGSLSTNVAKMEAAYKTVCDRAFQNVPPAVQQLRPECLAHVKQYLAQLALKNASDRVNLPIAGRNLWQAVRHWPRILTESKTWKLLIKLTLLWLVPSSGSRLLKKVTVQRGSEYVEA